jgi:hypothetical protein
MSKNKPPQQNMQKMHDNEQTDVPVDTDSIADQSLIAFVSEFSTNTVKDMIKHRTDADNILELLKTVSENSELINAIETITSHTVSNKQAVTDASDSIVDMLGMKPFDVDVTSPDNEFQDPMVSIAIDDVWMTNNEEINAELVSYAGRIRAETGQGQKRLFKKWSDAIGESKVKAFKRNQDDPEALNFVIPSHIPATGDDENRTPITEIPYIGDATAKEIHPNDEVMSIEDYANLTKKQHSIITLPLAEKDYHTGDNTRFYKMLDGFLELIPDNANISDMIGHGLGWTNKEQVNSDMKWIDSKKIIGFTTDTDHEFNTQDVFTLNRTSKTVMKTGRNSEKEMTELHSHDTESVLVDTRYWNVFTRIAEKTSANIRFGTNENVPVFAEFPQGEQLALAHQ